MAVTIYRSTDAGALATLPAASPVTLRADFMLAILKACLVTGYGSKAGAGWSVVYEDTTATKRRLALSNGNGVIEFVTWGNGLGIFVWDSITTPGAGAISVDTYASVISTGVNGWQHQNVPINNPSSSIAGINLTYLVSTNQSTTAWTIHADDKSVHVCFHYPVGNAGVAPGQNAANSRHTTHPMIFFGALKSPDLLRDDPGNLFVAYGNAGIQPSNSIPQSGSASSFDYFWGLRIPTGDVPVMGNNPAFSISHWNAQEVPGNPYSSVRPIIPAIVNYIGSDVLRPPAMAAGLAFYAFATIPGLAYFSQQGQTAYDFWGFYTAIYSTTWTLEPLTIGGIQWIPRPIGANLSTRNNYGITDDAAWWS